MVLVRVVGGGERDGACAWGDGSVVACTHPYAGVTQRDRYAHTISADDRVGRVIPEPVLPVVQELAGVPRLGLAFWPVGEGKCPCT